MSMHDPAAIDAANQAAARNNQAPDPRGDPRANQPFGPGGRPPNSGGPPPNPQARPDARPAAGAVDVNALRGMIQRGEVTPDQVMQMVQQGKLDPSIVQQLGFGKADTKQPPSSNNKAPYVPPSTAKPSGKSQPQGQPISRARHVMRTRVRKFLIKSFGTVCTINSVITTIFCFAKIEETWRGMPGSWSAIGVVLGLIVGVWLWLWQLALSDWDSPGVFFGYWVVLAPDVVMTTLPWYHGVLYPLFANSMSNPEAAVPVALGIAIVWALISSKASDWAFLGRPALSLLERIAGGRV